MPTLFKEVNYNLAALVQQIDLGAIGLPDIQRPFVWPDTKVRDLFDSMYKGYPVGYLLFWANANIEGVNVKGIGTSEKQKHPSLLIVDGQQRLTSLYAVIKGQAYVFFLIGRVDLGMDMFRLKKLTARWFFMSSLTGRYTSSPESQMESDLARIRTIRSGDEFEQILEEIIAGQFTSDYWALNLPRALATSASTSPSLYAYYASLHILDAFGLFSRLKVSDLFQEGLRANKSALERHHLFPKAYLQKIGIVDQRDTNQIANFALVEWSDNIEISDRSPAEYLPGYLSRLSEEDRKKMYFWHALPEGWEKMAYSDFLQKRRIMIAEVVKAAFERL